MYRHPNIRNNQKSHRVRLQGHPYQVRGNGVVGGVASAPSMIPQSTAGTPAGCVRGQPAYIGKQECELNKPASETCNPRFINGAWDRFAPYARDTLACGGAEPPNLASQILNDASLVQATSWESLSNLSLGLMMEGKVGSFTYSMAGGPSQTVDFYQKDLVQELDKPLMYVYATPHGSGVMRLTLNLTNGRASVSWPIGNGFGNVQYSISTV